MANTAKLRLKDGTWIRVNPELKRCLSTNLRNEELGLYSQIPIDQLIMYSARAFARHANGALHERIVAFRLWRRCGLVATTVALICFFVLLIIVHSFGISRAFGMTSLVSAGAAWLASMYTSIKVRERTALAAARVITGCMEYFCDDWKCPQCGSYLLTAQVSERRVTCSRCGCALEAAALRYAIGELRAAPMSAELVSAEASRHDLFEARRGLLPRIKHMLILSVVMIAAVIVAVVVAVVIVKLGII